jgi:hypothetical protein
VPILDKAKFNFALSMPALNNSWNNNMAGSRSSMLAPVGWITRSDCLAISRVALLALAGPSIISKS